MASAQRQAVIDALFHGNANEYDAQVVHSKLSSGFGVHVPRSQDPDPVYCQRKNLCQPKPLPEPEPEPEPRSEPERESSAVQLSRVRELTDDRRQAQEFEQLWRKEHSQLAEELREQKEVTAELLTALSLVRAFHPHVQQNPAHPLDHEFTSCPVTQEFVKLQQSVYRDLRRKRVLARQEAEALKRAEEQRKQLLY